jgi:hypothetical protein
VAGAVAVAVAVRVTVVLAVAVWLVGVEELCEAVAAVEGA